MPEPSARPRLVGGARTPPLWARSLWTRAAGVRGHGWLRTRAVCRRDGRRSEVSGWDTSSGASQHHLQHHATHSSRALCLISNP